MQAPNAFGCRSASDLLGRWNLYFIAKLALFAMGLIGFHLVENLGSPWRSPRCRCPRRGASARGSACRWRSRCSTTTRGCRGSRARRPPPAWCRVQRRLSRGARRALRQLDGDRGARGHRGGLLRHPRGSGSPTRGRGGDGGPGPGARAADDADPGLPSPRRPARPRRRREDPDAYAGRLLPQRGDALGCVPETAGVGARVRRDLPSRVLDVGGTTSRPRHGRASAALSRRSTSC